MRRPPEQADGKEAVVRKLAGLAGGCHGCQRRLQLAAACVRHQAVRAGQPPRLRLQRLSVSLASDNKAHSSTADARVTQQGGSVSHCSRRRCGRPALALDIVLH